MSIEFTNKPKKYGIYSIFKEMLSHLSAEYYYIQKFDSFIEESEEKSKETFEKYKNSLKYYNPEEVPKRIINSLINNLNNHIRIYRNIISHEENLNFENFKDYRSQFIDPLSSTEDPRCIIKIIEKIDILPNHKWWGFLVKKALA